MENQILHEILSEVKGLKQGQQQINSRLDNLEVRFDNLEKEVGDVKQELGDVKQELGDVKQELGDVKQELGDVKQELGDVKQELGDVKQELGSLKHRFDTHEKLTTETHENVCYLEGELVPKINILYETRVDLHPRVEKLESTVEKLKFGSEVIRLVEIIESRTKA